MPTSIEPVRSEAERSAPRGVRAGSVSPPAGAPRRFRKWHAALAILAVRVLIGVLAVEVAVVRRTRATHARTPARWASLRSRQHQGPVARVDELQGSGRVYLAQMGASQQPHGAKEMAEWLHGKYGLDVQVLGAVPIERSAWDPDRQQYVGELLGEELQRAYPEIAREPDASLIGVTDESMYRAAETDELSYTTRLNQHVAVVSTYGFAAHGLLPLWPGKPGVAQAGVQAKLRRFVLKDVAILHWHLPLNHDPTSLLQENLSPETPAEDIYESDLHPEKTPGGEAIPWPCLYLTYTPAGGMRAMPGPVVRPCTLGSPASSDESQEVIEVDLGNGVVRDERTDLYLPDSVPITMQRILRPGGTNPTEFGASGNHSLNKYLWANGMSELHKAGPEFVDEKLLRTPVWLPIELLDKWTDPYRSERFATLTYHLLPRESFDLKDLEGNVETYLPCEGTIPCYLDGYRNAQGQALRFERRGKDRELVQVTSPNGSWLRFRYDAAERVTEIDDSRGRAVQYGYNPRNQLTRVTHPEGEVVLYEYDGRQRLLALSVARDAASTPQCLLRNAYGPAGRLVRQTLADGTAYSYAYHPTAQPVTQWVTVTTPEGRTLDLYSRGQDASLVEVAGGS